MRSARGTTTDRMPGHRRLSQPRAYLCADGLRRPWVECTAVGWSEREMAVWLLLSRRAVLDRLLRGLVNFLWCDQYRCSGRHGPTGVDRQREGCCIHVARQIGNDYEVVAPKGIVVGFQSPTHFLQ